MLKIIDKKFENRNIIQVYIATSLIIFYCPCSIQTLKHKVKIIIKSTITRSITKQDFPKQINVKDPNHKLYVDSRLYSSIALYVLSSQALGKAPRRPTDRTDVL